MSVRVRLFRDESSLVTAAQATYSVLPATRSQLGSWHGRIFAAEDATALWEAFTSGKDLRMELEDGIDGRIILRDYGGDEADFIGTGPPPGISIMSERADRR